MDGGGQSAFSYHPVSVPERGQQLRFWKTDTGVDSLTHFVDWRQGGINTAPPSNLAEKNLSRIFWHIQSMGVNSILRRIQWNKFWRGRGLVVMRPGCGCIQTVTPLDKSSGKSEESISTCKIEHQAYDGKRGAVHSSSSSSFLPPGSGRRSATCSASPFVAAKLSCVSKSQCVS